MIVKTITKVKPTFPFEAYSHIVSPIAAADGGGFMFTMPDIPGVMADGATEMQAIADGREAFIATVSAMADMEQEVPVPAFNAEDFTPASASGKVLARLPRSMHLQLTQCSTCLSAVISHHCGADAVVMSPTPHP
jgi:antitoxin HicB